MIQLSFPLTIFLPWKRGTEIFSRGFEKEMARMDSPECFFNSIGPDLQKKRDALAKVLEDVGLNPVVPEGGYFIMADWSKFADKVR